MKKIVLGIIAVLGLLFLLCPVNKEPTITIIRKDD